MLPTVLITLLIFAVLAVVLRMRCGGRGGKERETNEMETKRDNAAYVVAE